jgi:hypothetical protein
MAYITGTANSYADLQAALFAACTANGYAVNGNVVSKGTLFCEVALMAANAGLSVQGGTGQAAGVLSGRSNGPLFYLGITIQTTMPTVNWPMTFPVTFYIHIGTAPDEVYLFVNYQTNCYQYIAFGQSDMPGLGGTGNWYAATARSNDIATNNSSWGYSTAGYGYSNYWSASLFDGSQSFGNAAGAVHHGMDGVPGSWLNNSSFQDRWTAQMQTPNAWNGESVLTPIVVYTARPSSFVSPVLQMGHARWVMLDNLLDQQIITLGGDRWKCYPVWRRGTSRKQSPAPTDGGTCFLGHAIRYDGP